MTNQPTRQDVANIVRKFFFHYDDRIDRLTEEIMGLLSRHAQGESNGSPSE